jgi:uncharacterized membrane protein
MEIENFVYIIALTFSPGLELRASIPYALLILNLDLFIIPIILLLNIILGEIVFYFLNTLLPLFLKIKIFEKFYNKYVGKVQRKARRYVEKYGVFGLAIFIGIPLPGSGVYSGALAAFIFGFKKKDFSKANILGVLIAGTIVTLTILSGSGIFNLKL